MQLPNGHTVDFLSNIFEEISRWIQIEPGMPEAGGFLVGYKDRRTENISIDDLSHPHEMDLKSRVHFTIKDFKHEHFLREAQKNKSFYMGVWHTHPQAIPEPSMIDWIDWKETLAIDKTACEYVFFLIMGTSGGRVWVGDYKTQEIIEIFECEKEGGLYKNYEI